MSEYSQRAISWINTVYSRYSDLIPAGMSKPNYSRMSDGALEEYVVNLEDAMKYGKNRTATPQSHGQQLYILPHEEADGSVTFVDRHTGRVVAGTQRMPNGLFGYFGPKEMLEVFFGRGGLDRMWARTEDSMFFRDEKKR